MLVINVDNGGIEKSLKVLKRRFAQTGVVRELRDRAEYTKPSARRRDVVKRAQHRARYQRLYGDA
jgi:small subunit ribosomal protein S21